MFKVLLVLFVSSSIAFANESSVSKEEYYMLKYINWITDNSKFSYNNEPLPSVKYLSQKELQVMQYGEEKVLSLRDGNISLPIILALYDRKTNSIIMNNEYSIEYYDTHHVLVHELVHFLQMVNNTSYNCLNELEKDAYTLQVKWQNEVNHPAERPDNFRMALLNIGCSAF